MWYCFISRSRKAFSEGWETEWSFKIQGCEVIWHETGLKRVYHVALPVSDYCLCHGADQHKLLVAELGGHRILLYVVCLCLVGILQVDDYTSLSWLTTRFLLWCNHHSNTHRWLTHCKKKKNMAINVNSLICLAFYKFYSSTVTVREAGKCAASVSHRSGMCAAQRQPVLLLFHLYHSSPCYGWGCWN